MSDWAVSLAISLAAFALLLAAARWASGLKAGGAFRLGGRLGGRGRLEVLAAIALGGGARAVLLRCDERSYLVILNGGALAIMDTADTAGAESPPNRGRLSSQPRRQPHPQSRHAQADASTRAIRGG